MTKGELTRKKIREAAAPIFNQHGYEGSSLNALIGSDRSEEGRHLLALRKQGGTGRRGLRLYMGSCLEGQTLARP